MSVHTVVSRNVHHGSQASKTCLVDSKTDRRRKQVFQAISKTVLLTGFQEYTSCRL